MTSQDYAKKLKDPRWQKRRLEIFQLHNFTCQDCGSTTDTLHAHHCFYMNGCEPWEYGNDAFRCLCEKCHETRHCAEKAAIYAFRRIMQRHDQDKLSEVEWLFHDAAHSGSGIQIITTSDTLKWPAEITEAFQKTNA